MTECKISIVIPVYNVEKYLAKCLDSVTGQTLEGCEIIAVNDGSRDSSLLILEQYQTAYKGRMAVYTTENRGVSHARNYGVSKASGKYVLFVDSDDYIELNMCELLYQKAEEEDADLVICDRNDFFEYEETGNIKTIKGNGFYMPFGRKIDLNDMKYELTHISPFPWDRLYRRELLCKFPFPENIRFEDLAVSYQIALSARRISVIPDYLYNYRRTSDGGFLNKFSAATLDITKALTKIVEDFKENGWFEEYYEELEYICARHILLRYSAVFGLKEKGKLKLKKQMIHETQDFLESNFRGWKKNRYLKYTLRNVIKKKYYKSRNSLIRQAVQLEYAPEVLIKVLQKIKNKSIAIKNSFRRFRKSRHKLSAIKKRLLFLKFFDQTAEMQYMAYYEKQDIDKKLVLFESKHGEDLAGNIFHLIASMQDGRYAGFRVLLALKERFWDAKERLLQKQGLDFVEIIQFGSPGYLSALASAKYLVTDTSFPTYFIKKPEQVYLNTWHGTPLKGMGRVVPKREYALGNIQRNFLSADYLLYQNTFSRDIFLRDYMLDKLYAGEILLSGYPRNSAFFNQEGREQIRSELHISEKQLIAYMPTWRGLLTQKETERQIYILLSYLHEIDNSLQDNQIFYVKLHPYVKKKMNYKAFKYIKPFPEEYETYAFLNAVDLLVSDYSSIIFDFAASGRDIVLFVYDKEEYLKDRGMYLDIEALEFKKAETVKELMQAIREPAAYPEFRKLYCPYDKASSADEAAEKVFLESRSLMQKEQIRTNKKRVFIFLGSMGKGDRTMQLIKKLNSLDTSRYDYFICISQSAVKAATGMLSALKKEIQYFPIVYHVAAARKEKAAFAAFMRFGIKAFGVWNTIEKIAAREARKYFCGTAMDYVINYSVKDKFLHLICQELPGTKILNLQEYEMRGPAAKKQKQQVKYLQRHAGKFDRIYKASESPVFIDDMLRKEEGLQHESRHLNLS